MQVLINAVKGLMNAESLGKEWINEIILTPKERLKNLEDKEIHVLDFNSGEKNHLRQSS